MTTDLATWVNSANRRLQTTQLDAHWDNDAGVWRVPFASEDERNGRTVRFCGPRWAPDPQAQRFIEQGRARMRRDLGDRYYWTDGGPDPDQQDPLWCGGSWWLNRDVSAAPYSAYDSQFMNWMRTRMAALAPSYPTTIVPNDANTMAHVYYADANTPRYNTITDATPGHGAGSPWEPHRKDVPIPGNAYPATGTDNHIGIYRVDTDELWEFWGFVRTDDAAGNFVSATVSSSGKIKDYSKSQAHFWGANGETGTGVSATGVPFAATALTLREMRYALDLYRNGKDPAEAVSHVVYMAISKPRSTELMDGTKRVFVPPAIRHDGESTDQYALPEGAILTFEPGDYWKSMPGLTEFERILLRIVQMRGLLVQDKAPHFNIGFQGPLAQETWFTGDDPSIVYENLLHPGKAYWQGPLANLPLDKMHLIQFGWGAPSDLEYKPIKRNKPSVEKAGGQNWDNSMDLAVYKGMASSQYGYLPAPNLLSTYDGLEMTAYNADTTYDYEVRTSGGTIDGAGSAVVLKPGEARIFKNTRSGWWTVGAYNIISPKVQNALDAKVNAPATGRAAGKILAAGPGASDMTWIDATSGDDPLAVKLTGDQTVTGVKTFSAAPVVPDAAFTQAKVANLTTDLASRATSQALGVTTPATLTYEDLQAAADAATASGTKLVAAGTITTSSTLVITCDADLTQLTYNYTGTGVAVQVGSGVSGVAGIVWCKNVRLPRIINTGKVGVGWSGNTTGARLINTFACNIRAPRVRNFVTGVHVDALGTGNVYNDIQLLQLENNKRNLVIGAGLNGWSNSNTYRLGILTHDSVEGNAVTGTRGILLDTAANYVNGNTFIGGSVEGAVSEYHLDVDGPYNRFTEVRWENAGGCRVVWRANAVRNVIDYGYGAQSLIETHIAGSASNRIYTTGISRVQGTTTAALTVYENTNSSGSGADAIMDPGATAAGTDPTVGYRVYRSGDATKMKRALDAQDRLRLDHVNGRVYFGDGVNAPASYLQLDSAGLLKLISASFYPSTNNTHDLGINATRWRTIRAATTLITGAFATGARPPASLGVGSMIYDSTLNRPLWSDGTAWVDLVSFDKALAGSLFRLPWNGSAWTWNGVALSARPTTRTDVYFDLYGAPAATPDPAWMLANDSRTDA